MFKIFTFFSKIRKIILIITFIIDNRVIYRYFFSILFLSLLSKLKLILLLIFFLSFEMELNLGLILKKCDIGERSFKYLCYMGI